MRNLKRALSLTLASVMLLGMMVVGTSAASFPDVDDNDNVEAIEVLNAVGVMIGDNGNFKPDTPVTRNEMAVIMAKLILGTYAADSYVGTHPFTDVPAWADRYVAACYASGIVAGRSATTYDGQSTVTAVEAAAMMLRALGYEDLSKNAARWDQPVAAKANEINLFEGMSGASNTAMNRNSVAKLALNTLKSTMVTTTRSGQDIKLPDGTTIASALNYNDRTTSTLDYTKSDGKFVASGVGASTDDKLQMCEFLYGTDLRMVAGDPDDFGRPADRKWEYKGDDVYNVPKSATITFTKDTSEDNVLKAIKGYTFNGTKVVDKTTAIGSTTTAIGDLTFSASTDKITAVVKAATANGKLVEIFADDDKNVTAVVIAQYSVGEVTKISTNKDGDVSYSISGFGTKKDFADPDKDDEIVIAGSIEEDDIVTCVTKSGVLYVYPTTSFNGTQSAYNINKATITVSGKTYDVGTGLSGVSITGAKDHFPNSSDEATFYVDQFGFVVKSDAVKTETNWAVVDEIVYVQGSGLSGSKYAEAKLVFADGTSKTVKVTEINGIKMKDASSLDSSSQGFLTTSDVADPVVTAVSLNKESATYNANLSGKVVKYSEKDNEYKLTYVDLKRNNSAAATDNVNNGKTVSVSDTETVTKKGVPGFGGDTPAASGNNNTVYIIKTGSDKFSTYTGYKNVIDVTANGGTVAVVYTSGDDGVEMVYVDASSNAKTGGDSGDIFYVTNKKVTTELNGDDTIYVLEGVLNGEAGELRADSTFNIDATGSQSFSNLTEDNLYEVEVDGDGYVTKMILQGAGGKTYVKENMTEAKEENAGIVAGKAYDDDTKVYVIDGDSVSEGGVKDARDGDLIYIKVKGSSGADAQTIEVMYVIKEKAETYYSVADFAAPSTNTATLAATKNAASVVAGGTASYEFSLAATSANTCRYTITLAGLSGVTVTNGTAPDVPANWDIVKVSDTEVTVNVKNTASLAGKITVSGTVTGAVTATAANAVQTYAMNNVADAVIDSGALKVKVEADKALAAAGDTVTYTVTVSGASAAGWTNEKIKIGGLSGLTGADALTVAKDANGADISHPNCDVSGLNVTITAADTATSGTFTVSGTATTTAVTPTVAYEA